MTLNYCNPPTSGTKLNYKSRGASAMTLEYYSMDTFAMTLSFTNTSTPHMSVRSLFAVDKTIFYHFMAFYVRSDEKLQSSTLPMAHNRLKRTIPPPLHMYYQIILRRGSLQFSEPCPHHRLDRASNTPEMM